MVKLQLFSKTPLAKRIKKNGFREIINGRSINIDNFIGKINQFNINPRKNVSNLEKMPGTLGWGFYAFDVKENAKDFQGSCGSNSDVLTFTIECDDEAFLDLWQDESAIKLLDDFIKREYVLAGIKAYRKYANNKAFKDSFQKSDIGIIIELFIKSVEKRYHKVDVVRMLTRNDFKSIPYIAMYNGVEYCVKDKCVIDEKTMQVV